MIPFLYVLLFVGVVIIVSAAIIGVRRIWTAITSRQHKLRTASDMMFAARTPPRSPSASRSTSSRS